LPELPTTLLYRCNVLANCFQAFQPGLLQSYEQAEERAFSKKMNMLFLGLFLIWVAAMLLLQLQAQLGGKRI